MKQEGKEKRAGAVSYAVFDESGIRKVEMGEVCVNACLLEGRAVLHQGPESEKDERH